MRGGVVIWGQRRSEAPPKHWIAVDCFVFVGRQHSIQCTRNRTAAGRHKSFVFRERQTGRQVGTGQVGRYGRQPIPDAGLTDELNENEFSKALAYLLVLAYREF